jgi:hypothetical protein
MMYPEMKAFLRRHLVRIAALALLLVVLPNALYLGHWPFLPGFADSTNAAEAHEHAGHCHAGPSKCTDAPPSSSPQPMLLNDSALGVVALGVLLLLAVDLRYSPVNPLAQRITKPPRRTSAVFAS